MKIKKNLILFFPNLNQVTNARSLRFTRANFMQIHNSENNLLK
jgi:hypothetical protein